MTTEEITAWFVGRLPGDWFTGPAHIRTDREEIVVSGPIEEPVLEGEPDDTARNASRTARVKRFREETRDARMRIADEAEHLFDRKVSWGASCGGTTYVFTNVAVPVMTRLRLGERAVLDTLIDAGVARSRSEALAWCVRLVEKNQQEWIDQLRDALTHVTKLRTEGPSVG
jgi:hypothetical protein